MAAFVANDAANDDTEDGDNNNNSEAVIPTFRRNDTNDGCVSSFANNTDDNDLDDCGNINELGSCFLWQFVARFYLL